jgi:GNAT superfamily N-acetyltransferase
MGLPDDFQGFATEVDGLPGTYQLLLLERVEGNPAGTVSLRPVTEHACEVKRLYVRQAYRGSGLGRKLMDRVIQQAKDLGYKTMYADTLPQMKAAQAMYKDIGFVETQPYSKEPTEGAIYLVLTLDNNSLTAASSWASRPE